MKQKLKLKHRFIDTMPDVLESGVLYVSIKYATVAHKCCCGCGNEVITPLTPTDWKLSYDGVSISLSPSIGNWSFKCKSHYWIKNNSVQWALMWTDEEIADGRKEDSLNKNDYFSSKTKRLDCSSLKKKKSTTWKKFISIFKRHKNK